MEFLLAALNFSLTYDRRDAIDVLAQDVVHCIVVEQGRLARDRIGTMQYHVAQIGTDSDLAAQMARLRLNPSPPHSRDSPPSSPSSLPQGSGVVSSWESLMP